MLTEDQIKDIEKFRGKRIHIKNIIQTLHLVADPKSPEYSVVRDEVARIVNRNVEISIRVADNELKDLKARAEKSKHKRLADYVRSAALGAEIKTPPPVQILPQGNNALDIRAAVRALQAASKNLNQLVLNLNVHNKHHIIDPETADRYRQEIERLLLELKKIEVPHG